MEATMREVSDMLEGLPVNQWVAVSTVQHKVMSYGDDLEEVHQRFRDLGEPEPLMTRTRDPRMVVNY